MAETRDRGFSLDDIILDPKIEAISIPKAGSIEKNGKAHTEYHIQVKYDSGVKIVKRRFSEFHSLNEQLKKRYGINMNFPGKKLFGSHKPQVIESRRTALDAFLKKIVEMSYPEVVKTKDVIKFLEPTEEKYVPEPLPPSFVIETIGSLEINIFEARNLDIPGKSSNHPIEIESNLPANSLELFCYYTIGTSQNQISLQSVSFSNQTGIQERTRSPVWNFSNTTTVTTLHQSIFFKVRSINAITLDDYVGGVEVELVQLANGVPLNTWLTIKDDKGVSRGDIHIGLLYVPKEYSTTTKVRTFSGSAPVMNDLL